MGGDIDDLRCEDEKQIRESGREILTGNPKRTPESISSHQIRVLYLTINPETEKWKGSQGRNSVNRSKNRLKSKIQREKNGHIFPLGFNTLCLREEKLDPVLVPHQVSITFSSYFAWFTGHILSPPSLFDIKKLPLLLLTCYLLHRCCTCVKSVVIISCKMLSSLFFFPNCLLSHNTEKTFKYSIIAYGASAWSFICYQLSFIKT